MTTTEDSDQTCRLVDDCPLINDCRSDDEAKSSLCPMKRWSFDELLCEPPECEECESLNQFEAALDKELTTQDRRDVSRYWMEHLNSHLERFVETQKARGAESEQT